MSTVVKWGIGIVVAWGVWHVGSGYLHPSNHFRERPPSVEITHVEPYELEATVLAVKWYWFGKEKVVSPVDLALAWGPLNRPDILDDLDVHHTNRYYHWYMDPEAVRKLGKRTVINNTANVHIIPDNFLIQEHLKDVKPGDRLGLVGYLVDVRAPEIGTWKTSRTRTDSGAGACEIFLVQNVTRF